MRRSRKLRSESRRRKKKWKSYAAGCNDGKFEGGFRKGMKWGWIKWGWVKDKFGYKKNWDKRT